MPTKSTKVKASKVFSEDEKDAMMARAREVKLGDADQEGAVLEKIAGMPPADRALGERFHALVKASAPALTPRLYYGMPAYARNGKVVVHFKAADKFKMRYATLEFSDPAHLDEGTLWPVAYALKQWSPANEAKIRALVKQAAG